MENAELDTALEELENRLERLRALYEQYFMGIERIEPAIPRKDIDRRIYVLRREKIRNTAKRFKLQTLISRYNTFQQYWQRICREIEQGTYKRHVIKAERIAPGKMLTIAARKRMGRAALEAMQPEEATTPSPVAPSSLPPPAAVAAPPVAAAPIAQAATGALPPLKPAVPAKPSPPAKPGVRPAPVAPEAAAPRAFESLDFNMDFLGDWDPSAPSARPQSKQPATPPTRPVANAGAGRPPAAPVRGTQPGIGPEPLPATPPKPARPAPLAPTAEVRPPSVAPRPVAAPPRPMRPADQPAAAPRPPPAPRPAAASSIAAARASSLGAAPLPKPAAPKPASAVPLTAVPATPVQPDDRVRHLHARLVEAKRQTQDAGKVSLEGLAKSIQATEAKLREVHKDRKIEFDVVIKDGKAVVKPIVR